MQLGALSKPVVRLIAATVLTAASGEALAQPIELTPKLPDLTGIVKDQDWARVLGKALFWDENAGSDGNACASCHFSAGADSRIVNQLSPGLLQLPTEDINFGAIAPPAKVSLTASGAVADSNYELVPNDFPFHQLVDETDRNSDIFITSNDRASSAGSFDMLFDDVGPKPDKSDTCGDASAAVFHAGGHPARMVEPRNTPTVINAVFYDRQFWDGRANKIFNGVTPFGKRDILNDPNVRIVVLNGGLHLEPFELDNASLASQAVGPPLSNFEMSCDNRTFPDIADKLLSNAVMPLQTQEVHGQDSLFGAPGPFGDLRDASGLGLSINYETLIENAFEDKYWAGGGKNRIDGGSLVPDPKGYTQMELNFSMFWGISIMLYEATLISDQSPFDLCNPGGNPLTCQNVADAMTADELAGLGIFRRFGGPASNGRGRCIACHGGDLQSSATVQAGGNFVGVDDADMPTTAADFNPPGPRSETLHDRGFFNIGLRPTAEDLGVGGTDPHGGPLSYSRMLVDEYSGGGPFPAAVSDPTGIHPCDVLVDPVGCPAGDPDLSIQRLGVDGAMKTPSLRNVALTPPYFHYGAYATGELALEFYNRGGSRRDISGNPADGDTSGTGPLGQQPPIPPGPNFGRNVDGNIRPLLLTEEHIDLLVAFLKALTDPRVQCDEAPFDHPQLHVPNGHLETDDDGDGKADDIIAVIPAVGAGGYEADGKSKLCLPNEANLFAKGMRNRLTMPKGGGGKGGGKNK